MVGIVCIAALSSAEAKTTEPHTAASQATTAPDALSGDVIVVFGQKRGSARGNPVPIETVDEHALKSAVGLSIEDVVGRLYQVGENNPRILINGRPADTMISVGALPSDAISRIEILPPATSAMYGEAVAGRVINVVLKPKFRTFQVNPSASFLEVGEMSDLGVMFQRTNLVDENQTVLAFNVRRNAPHSEPHESSRRNAKLVSPELFDLSANAAFQRAITEGALLGVNGGFGFGKTTLFGSGQTILSNIDRRNWNFGSTLSGRLEQYLYSLRVSFDGSEEVQRLNRLRSDNGVTNARLSFSANGTIVEMGQGSIQGQFRADYRWSSHRTDQIESWDRVRVAKKEDQIDLGIGMVVPWSNGRRATEGALATSISLEGLRIGQDWGRKFAGSIGWTPLAALTIDGSFSSENLGPIQDFQSRPSTSYEPVFDKNEGGYRVVKVLRDERANRGRVDLNQVDLRVNFEFQSIVPINIGINFGRSIDSGKYDRPSANSDSFELIQPSRYIRDGTGALSMLDLRTRKLAAQRRDTVGFRVGAIYSFNETSESGSSPGPPRNAVEAVTSTHALIDMSLESHLISVAGQEIGQDQGLGEARSRTTMRIGVSKGRSSVIVTLDREGGKLLREDAATVVQAPAPIYGALEVSLPVRRLIGVAVGTEGPQLRASLSNLLLFETTEAQTLGGPNRRLLEQQRQFRALLTISFRL